MAAITRDPLVVGTPAMWIRSLTATLSPDEPAVSKRVMKVATAAASHRLDSTGGEVLYSMGRAEGET